MNTAIIRPTATLLNSGKVLVTGGRSPCPGVSDDAGNNIYAAATHANGLAASGSGTILGAFPDTASPVTVSFDSATVTNSSQSGVILSVGP